MDTLVVPRATFSMEEPWAIPAGCDAVRLRRAEDGNAPRLSTTVAAYFDDESLTVLFCGTDDHVVATLRAHDDPLWKEDVVEVFLAPERLTEYFELEVSPLGTTFDARITSPEGNRQTMETDLGWTCEGFITAIRTMHESDGALSIDTVLRIPFAALGRGVPQAGETWRANFYRIDRHPLRGDEYTAWQPTMKQPANFHVPGVFGTLVFG